MGRPVPSGTNPAGSVASAWAPIQRDPSGGEQAVPASAAPDQTTGVVPAVSTSPTTPDPTTPGLTTSGLTMPGLPPPGLPTTDPTTPGTVVSLAPMPMATQDPKAEKKGKDDDKGQQLLPPPRTVGPSRITGGSSTSRNGGLHVPPPMQQGYPELPPPLIPHPVDAPKEGGKRAYSPYVIEPPDILLIRATPAVTFKTMPIDGTHLVRMDGTVSLGVYGDVFVAGRTIQGARMAVAQALIAQVWKEAPDPKKKKEGERFTLEEVLAELQVDVAVYNSKFYYVITDGAGYGEQVIRIPTTGNETVLDALAQIQGLPAQASKKKIWVARATPGDHHPMILPVDWCSITQRGSASTNYQVFPNDRIYVHSDVRLRTLSNLEKFLNPIDRVFGTLLLGSSAINSIKNGTNSGGGGSGLR